MAAAGAVCLRRRKWLCVARSVRARFSGTSAVSTSVAPAVSGSLGPGGPPRREGRSRRREGRPRGSTSGRRRRSIPHHRSAPVAVLKGTGRAVETRGPPGAPAAVIGEGHASDARCDPQRLEADFGQLRVRPGHCQRYAWRGELLRSSCAVVTDCGACELLYEQVDLYHLCQRRRDAARFASHYRTHLM